MKSKINWRKIGLNLLFPHLAVIVLLLPISTSFLIYSLIYFNSNSLIAIISYLLAFYTLLIICFRIPKIFIHLKAFKRKNKLIRKLFSDVHLRINISLYSSLMWNIIFAIFQLGLSFYHKSFWYYSMFAYYIILSIMRFSLFKHTRVYNVNEKIKLEAKKTIFCGYLLILINIVLSVIIFFIIYWNKTFNHNVITTITMAVYTFSTFTFAIINLIKYNKYKSLIYTSAKIITLISACVSVLTLETTMLSTFSNGEQPMFKQIILSSTGITVMLISILLSVLMIVKGKRIVKK